MRFTERSLFLGVDSLRLFEYLRHLADYPKAMVDVATYVAVNQDIRVALGLAENLIAAKFLSYDPNDDCEREALDVSWPRLRKQYYLTRTCYGFLDNPYLKARSANLEGPHWAVDEEMEAQPLPAFEGIEIERPFEVTNARWLQGTIQTNSYMKGRIAPGLVHPAERDVDRYPQLYRVKVLVDDPNEGRSRYIDDVRTLGYGEEDDVAVSTEEAKEPPGGSGPMKYDGAGLFGISYRDSCSEACQIEAGRSFEADGSTWRLGVELACDVDIGKFYPSDLTLLQSTLNAVIGADLVRLAYLASETGRASVECSIRFLSGNLDGLKESMKDLAGTEGFWAPIPPRLHDRFRIILK